MTSACCCSRYSWWWCKSSSSRLPWTTDRPRQVKEEKRVFPLLEQTMALWGCSVRITFGNGDHRNRESAFCLLPLLVQWACLLTSFPCVVTGKPSSTFLPDSSSAKSSCLPCRSCTRPTRPSLDTLDWLLRQRCLSPRSWPTCGRARPRDSGSRCSLRGWVVTR